MHKDTPSILSALLALVRLISAAPAPIFPLAAGTQPIIPYAAATNPLLPRATGVLSTLAPEPQSVQISYGLAPSSAPVAPDPASVLVESIFPALITEGVVRRGPQDAQATDAPAVNLQAKRQEIANATSAAPLPPLTTASPPPPESVVIESYVPELVSLGLIPFGPPGSYPESTVPSATSQVVPTIITSS